MKKKYRCTVCDHTYDPAEGDPDRAGNGLRRPPGGLGVPRLRGDEGRLRSDGLKRVES
jgi:hypothetical protein